MKKLILSLAVLIIAISLAVVESADSEQEMISYAKTEVRADWEVSKPASLDNETKYLEGNLTITSTGILTLNNATLILNCDYNGEYHIEVQDGGKLYAYNNSNITASKARYLFWACEGSTLVLENTTLSYCGYKEKLKAGLHISTDDARLKNCTLEHNHYGIYCNQSSPRIENCTIAYNTFGIRVEGTFYNALPYIANNTIVSNENYGIYCKRDVSTITGNDIFYNGGDGLYTDHSGATITENDIFYNQGNGLYCYYSHHTLIGNNNISGSKYGITCERSEIDEIKNNLLENNVYGIYCDSSTTVLSFYNNTVLNGTEGIFCSADSTMNIYKSTIRNASAYGIHFCSSGEIAGEIAWSNITENKIGIYCDKGTPNITYNNITRNTDAGLFCNYSAPSIFENNTLSNNRWGIYAAGASTSVEKNTFENNLEGILWQEWYPTIHVINQADGSYEAGAEVTVKNRSGVEVFYKITESTGILSTNITEYKILNDLTTVSHTAHEITAYKEHVGKDTKIVNLDGNKVIMLYLKIPDLTPIDLFTVGSLTEGNQVTVGSHVRNQGTLSATNVLVTFLCDDEPIGTVRKNILAQSTENFSVIWIAVKGQHELRVEVDLEQAIEESIEINNNYTSSIYVNTKPIANLSTPLGEVYTYEDVTFNAALSHDPDPGGMVVEYLFEFGDGTNSSWTSKWMVKHNYTHKGTYTPRVKVRDNFNTGVESEYSTGQSIRVLNRLPLSNLTASKLEAWTYEDILFYATGSYDGEELYEELYGEVGHRIIRYYWDFGDLTTLTTTEPIVSHKYEDDGNYTVTLIVQDDDLDNSTAKTLEVQILNREPATPIFSVTKKLASVNEKLEFNASLAGDLDGVIINYTWDFGDGTKGYGKLCEHRYAQPGIYLVTLTVFDDDGANSTYQMWVEIKPLPSWLELHYKELYLIIVIICTAGAIFFSARWYVGAQRREREVKAWAELKGAEKEKALEAKVKEWAKRKKKLKTLDERLKEWSRLRAAEKLAKEKRVEEWAKLREEEKLKKRLKKWAERKKAEKKS